MDGEGKVIRLPMKRQYSKSLDIFGVNRYIVTLIIIIFQSER